MKRVLLNALCAILLLGIFICIIWGVANKDKDPQSSIEDGVVQVDLNSIFLEGSGVEVNFADVLLSSHNETRQLIVSEQTGTVRTMLTDRLIKKLDFDFLKKTQNVSYTGTGYFVVDLDKLTAEDIDYDKKAKRLTIRVDHSYLKAIEINPDNIIIDEVNEGLLARGDIELTVSDYRAIESELRDRMMSKFSVASNVQKADDAALRMVKEVFDPVIHAIDRDVELVIKFK